MANIMKNTTLSEKLVKEFSYLTPNPATSRQKTDNVRKHLRHCFPGVKFSVRYSSGTWSDDIRISYADGPVSEAVEKAAKLFAYDSSNCDPMTDYFEYNPTEFTRTFGGFTFVFVDREMSEETYKELREEVARDFPTLPDISMTKDEFFYVYLKNAPRAVCEKYVKALSGAYWVSVHSLARLLFTARDYTPAAPADLPAAETSESCLRTN